MQSCRFRKPLPWLEPQPDNAPLREASEAGMRHVEDHTIRIQPVSEKPERKPDVVKKVVMPTDAVEEDDDDSNPLIDMLGKVPFCGEKIVDQLTAE